MKYEDPYDRKAYVEQVKRSFEDREEAHVSRKPGAEAPYGEEEAAGRFGGLKLRIFLSVFLFAAALLCYLADYRVFGVSVTDLMDKIAHNYSYAALGELFLR